MKAQKLRRGYLLIALLFIPQPALLPKSWNRGQRPIDSSTCKTMLAAGAHARGQDWEPLVETEVQVMSTLTGSIVATLRHDDFLLWENGIPKDIYSFRALRARLSILIAVDVGESLRQVTSGHMNTLISALGACLEPGDEVAVVSLRDRPSVMLKYTNARYAVSQALHRATEYKDNPKKAIGERLSDAVRAAAELHEVPDQNVRQVILVISHIGGLEKERMGADIIQVIAQAQSAVLWEGEGAISPESGPAVDAVPNANVTVAKLVDLSGGRFINDEWQPYLERMRTIYRIAYVGDARKSGELVSLRVGLKSELNPSDFEVTYRRIAVVPKLRAATK